MAQRRVPRSLQASRGTLDGPRHRVLRRAAPLDLRCRAASSCSRRTHGTRTTTSADRTSTPARPRHRSNDRSHSGCSPSPKHTASGSSTAPAVQRLHRSARPRHVARHGRVGRAGASVRDVGRRSRHRPRLRDERRSRAATCSCSTAIACTSASVTTSTGRGRCVTAVEQFAPPAATSRSSPATRATGRCASRAPDGVLQAPIRRGSGVRHRPAAPDDHDLVGPDRRPARNALTGVTFTRGGYHRIGRSVRRGSGGYEVHRPEHWLLDGTGLGAAICSARPRRGRLRVRRLRHDARDGLPVATGAGRNAAGFRSGGVPRRRRRSTSTPRRCRSRRAVRTSSSSTPTAARRRVAAASRAATSRPCRARHVPARRHGGHRRNDRVGLRIVRSRGGPRDAHHRRATFVGERPPRREVTTGTVTAPWSRCC